jgi:hypothetical protein
MTAPEGQTRPEDNRVPETAGLEPTEPHEQGLDLSVPFVPFVFPI